jgi:cytochrome d ubiquinol oxidase subunit II
VLAILSIRRGGGRGTRVFAVGVVVTMVWAWAVAQYPYLLPETLTVEDGAGVSGTLTAVIVVFFVALATVGPSLALLFRLAQRQALE